MQAKPFYLTKVFWINMIALVAFIVQLWVKDFIIPLPVQGAILAIIEIVLSLVLKEEVVLTRKRADSLNKSRGLK